MCCYNIAHSIHNIYIGCQGIYGTAAKVNNKYFAERLARIKQFRSFRANIASSSRKNITISRTRIFSPYVHDVHKTVFIRLTGYNILCIVVRSLTLCTAAAPHLYMHMCAGLATCFIWGNTLGRSISTTSLMFGRYICTKYYYIYSAYVIQMGGSILYTTGSGVCVQGWIIRHKHTFIYRTYT